MRKRCWVVSGEEQGRRFEKRDDGANFQERTKVGAPHGKTILAYEGIALCLKGERLVNTYTAGLDTSVRWYSVQVNPFGREEETGLSIATTRRCLLRIARWITAAVMKTTTKKKKTTTTITTTTTTNRSSSSRSRSSGGGSGSEVNH